MQIVDEDLSSQTSEVKDKFWRSPLWFPSAGTDNWNLFMYSFWVGDIITSKRIFVKGVLITSHVKKKNAQHSGTAKEYLCQSIIW